MTHSRSLKARVVHALRNGMTIRGAVTRYGVPKDTVRSWARAQGVDGRARAAARRMRAGDELRQLVEDQNKGFYGRRMLALAARDQRMQLSERRISQLQARMYPRVVQFKRHVRTRRIEYNVNHAGEVLS
eukprot:Hpha_TRINITY_DN2096_c0_g1::TRINITY_DN2096_c0_g1_i1::g.83066::m.83066